MRIEVDDFANSFGIKSTDIPPRTLALIQSLDFTLIPLSKPERDSLLVKIIDTVQKDKKNVSAKDRPDVWNVGWAENLKKFQKSRDIDESVVPRFIKSDLPIRWKQEYWRTNNPTFELDFIRVLREFIYENYFSKVSALCEFGAGSGHNLIHAAASLPDTTLIGTDYAPSAIELMQEIARSEGIQLTAKLVNMKNPSESELVLPKDSGVLTICAIEQVGGDFNELFTFLVQQQIKICVNIEPTNEFYDPSNLVDYLALWFQSNRGYPSGIGRALSQMELQGQIIVHKSKRLGFGSLLSEGYNLFVWSPIVPVRKD